MFVFRAEKWLLRALGSSIYCPVFLKFWSCSLCRNKTHFNIVMICSETYTLNYRHLLQSLSSAERCVYVHLSQLPWRTLYAFWYVQRIACIHHCVKRYSLNKLNQNIERNRNVEARVRYEELSIFFWHIWYRISGKIFSPLNIFIKLNSQNSQKRIYFTRNVLIHNLRIVRFISVLQPDVLSLHYF